MLTTFLCSVLLSFGSAFNQVELSPQTETSTCPKILTLVPNPVASKRASAVNTDQTFHRSLNSAPVTPGERREQGLQLQLLLLKSFDMWGERRGEGGVLGGRGTLRARDEGRKTMLRDGALGGRASREARAPTARHEQSVTG